MFTAKIHKIGRHLIMNFSKSVLKPFELFNSIYNKIENFSKHRIKKQFYFAIDYLNEVLHRVSWIYCRIILSLSLSLSLFRYDYILFAIVIYFAYLNSTRDPLSSLYSYFIPKFYLIRSHSVWMNGCATDCKTEQE